MDWGHDHALNVVAASLVAFAAGWIMGYLKGRSENPW